MSDVLLNFSGHKLCLKSRKLLENKFKIVEDIPFFEINFQSDVEEQIRSIVRKIKAPLDGSLSISIIPPGHSTLAILILVFLHGILGYFPKICLLQAEESGRYIPTSLFCIDGYLMRKAGRSFRQEIWEKDSSNKEKLTKRCS